jgi:SAM-dependent methyltransferase
MSLKPITRKIRWISSVDPENRLELEEFEAKMARYYSTNTGYYPAIDFTHSAWQVDPPYLRIRELVKGSSRALEVGCGAANILRYEKEVEANYTGCDFSTDLLNANKEKYTKATFITLSSPKKLPFPDGHFDLVFSVYVLEHVVFPELFLRECSRVLAPGGTLALRFPDFLNKDKMTSQVAGFSDGSGREKLKQGRAFDALVTGYDRKFRIPAMTRRCRNAIGPGYKFYINVNPVCFKHVFQPDYDAVYLTYRPEIRACLTAQVVFQPDSPDLDGRDIFMEGRKVV